jgi:hypothetical protein
MLLIPRIVLGVLIIFAPPAAEILMWDGPIDLMSLVMAAAAGVAVYATLFWVVLR